MKTTTTSPNHYFQIDILGAPHFASAELAERYVRGLRMRPDGDIFITEVTRIAHDKQSLGDCSVCNVNGWVEGPGTGSWECINCRNYVAKTSVQREVTAVVGPALV